MTIQPRDRAGRFGEKPRGEADLDDVDVEEKSNPVRDWDDPLCEENQTQRLDRNGAVWVWNEKRGAFQQRSAFGDPVYLNTPALIDHFHGPVTFRPEEDIAAEEERRARRRERLAAREAELAARKAAEAAM